jgi:hypothetical protein
MRTTTLTVFLIALATHVYVPMSLASAFLTSHQSMLAYVEFDVHCCANVHDYCIQGATLRNRLYVQAEYKYRHHVHGLWRLCVGNRTTWCWARK